MLLHVFFKQRTLIGWRLCKSISSCRLHKPGALQTHRKLQIFAFKPYAPPLSQNLGSTPITNPWSRPITSHRLQPHHKPLCSAPSQTIDTAPVTNTRHRPRHRPIVFPPSQTLGADPRHKHWASPPLQVIGTATVTNPKLRPPSQTIGSAPVTNTRLQPHHKH